MRALYRPFKGFYRALIPSFPTKSQPEKGKAGLLLATSEPHRSYGIFVLTKGIIGMTIFSFFLCEGGS